MNGTSFYSKLYIISVPQTGWVTIFEFGLHSYWVTTVKGNLIKHLVCICFEGIPVYKPLWLFVFVSHKKMDCKLCKLATELYSLQASSVHWPPAFTFCKSLYQLMWSQTPPKLCPPLNLSLCLGRTLSDCSIIIEENFQISNSKESLMEKLSWIVVLVLSLDVPVQYVSCRKLLLIGA